MGKAAGMTDVARLAGVSHQTVSRVLNGHPSVRDTTRERVLAAMRELDYRPNRLARALATARSGLLGVVTSGSARYGPMSTLLTIEEAARAEGYAVHVHSMRGEAAGSLDTTLTAFDSQAVEAVVVIAPRASAVEALAGITSRAPLVLVAAGVAPTERFDVVAVDQSGGARAVTRHLLDLGHTRIAHLSGPSDWFDARERALGFRAELAAAGLAPAGVWEGDWGADAGYRLGLELAEYDDDARPTAVVVANDQMALGLLRALAEKGIRVPEDISVTGFDDIEGADYFQPPLTTVRQDFPALADLVMARVLAAVPAAAGAGAGSATAPHAGPGPTPTVAPELVVRSSTAPPPAATSGD